MRATRFSALWLFMSVVAAVTAAFGEGPDGRRAAWRAKMEQLSKVEQRIGETKPVRREKPLRELNATDGEVREIRSVVATVAPRSIVYISSVVTGCPCEDGRECTDQVWVVAQRAGASRGLLLSKIADHWTIGPVQRWWLEYEAFRARLPPRLSMSDDNAEDDLKLRFPACVGKTEAPDTNF
jgi:hypothetical protein